MVASPLRSSSFQGGPTLAEQSQPLSPSKAVVVTSNTNNANSSSGGRNTSNMLTPRQSTTPNSTSNNNNTTTGGGMLLLPPSRGNNSPDTSKGSLNNHNNNLEGRSADGSSAASDRKKQTMARSTGGCGTTGTLGEGSASSSIENVNESNNVNVVGVSNIEVGGSGAIHRHNHRGGGGNNLTPEKNAKLLLPANTTSSSNNNIMSTSISSSSPPKPTLIPKNPKDTTSTSTTSPLGGISNSTAITTNNINNSSSSSNLMNTATTAGASPKRRAKNVLVANSSTITSNSVGMPLSSSNRSVGSGVRSVRSYGGGATAAASGAGGGGGVGYRSTLNANSPTPGSVDGLQSIKDISTTSSRIMMASPSARIAGGSVGSPHTTTNSNLHPSSSNGMSASGNHNNHPPKHQHSLDDEEQYMFEQRLTQDELGVAIRKISHSGKAQLRYVKCVPLRPPSSSDFEEEEGLLDPLITTTSTTMTRIGGGVGVGVAIGGGSSIHNGNNNNKNNVPYLDHTSLVAGMGRTSFSKTNIPSDSISVSSKSSTGSRFLERMRSTGSGVISRNGGRLFHTILPGGVGSGGGGGVGVGGGGGSGVNPNATLGSARLTSNNTSGGGPLVGGNIGIMDDTDEEKGCGVSDNLLLHDNNNSGMMMMMMTAMDGTTTEHKSHRALTWGKKNAVILSLDKFTCVRKGKTTERTLRNSSSSSRLLSIMTNVRGNESLDIEAPTMLDRDKFASAFSRFLGVPLLEEEDVVAESVGGGSGVGGGRSRSTVAGGGSAVMKKIRTPSLTRTRKLSSALSAAPSTARSEPGHRLSSARLTPNTTSESLLPALTLNSDEASAVDRELAFEHGFGDGKETISSSANLLKPPPRKASENEFSFSGVTSSASPSAGRAPSSSAVSRTGSSSRAGDTTMSKHTIDTMSESARKRISLDGHQARESMLEPRISAPIDAASPIHITGAPSDHQTDSHHPVDNTDNHSHVSSLTGGVDQEIVEELHQAIIELRTELDASRAEAARAVKVAEQAIQSAENCTSSDWNSTVTHKAAEAAAQAQRKSAEAIARARIAEERLAAERKSAKFWRMQAQAAEEEAGGLKTRSAAAEVKQAVVTEELASERRKAARMFATLKKEFQEAEKQQGEELNTVLDRKRMLEVELKELKEKLDKKSADEKRPLEMDRNEKTKGPHRLRPNFRRQRDPSCPKSKEYSSKGSLSIASSTSESLPPQNEAIDNRIAELQQQATTVRRQFELVRHTTVDEVLSLKQLSEEWSKQAFRAVAASTAEGDHLREKLAAESAMRLKLLNSLQDIRGTVRVYCRPRPTEILPEGIQPKSILTIPTHDILVLNEDTSPVSFQYDRIFSPGASQSEVFSELEEPLISSLDGFNVTLIAYGQGGSGKTHTLLGDVSFDEEENGLPNLKSHGVQLQAIEQLFNIAGHRTERYKDKFSMTVVEVHNEKLFDRVAGTPSAEEDGEVIVCETRDRRETIGNWTKGKLEIRTNIDGNTVVQGLVSIQINSFEKAVTILQESIANRIEQLRGQGSNWKKHERKTTVISTIHISSVNIATGVGTEGRLQFVDMAASDILQGGTKVKEDSDVSSRVEGDDIQYVNRSIDAFNEVIQARCQFDRSVPYRNSTLTHLLRDSLEADTKVLLLCCINSDEANLPNTVSSLRFASRMQKVSIGKATKHVIGSKE